MICPHCKKPILTEGEKEILKCIRKGKIKNKMISDLLDYSPALVSYHLKRLLDDKVIMKVYKDQSSFYEIV